MNSKHLNTVVLSRNSVKFSPCFSIDIELAVLILVIYYSHRFFPHQ
jgi:hypothetical protein